MKLATLCYVKHQGKTLMLHRVKKVNDIHEGKWNGLGGKFQAGETPEACARREIFEESGLTANSLDFKGILTFPSFDKGEDWYVFVFVVRDFCGMLISCNEGELNWIEDNNLLSLPLWEGDRLFLPWLSKPQIFSASFHYQNRELLHHEVSFYPERIHA